MLKKLLTWTGRGLAALLTIVAGLLLYVQLDGLPHFQRVTPARHVEVTPERVARGRKLASLLCVHCHLDSNSGRLTGKVMADLPPEFGTIVSKNITRSRSKGIGAWSDGQLAYLLRTGIRPDGRYVPPYMVKLPHASDEDLDSIIAFLHSDDPMLAAAEVDPPGVTQPSLLVKALAHSVMGPLPFPEQPISAPLSSDRVAYGRYLVYSLDCYSCHSADFKSVNIMNPPASEGYLGGGNKLLDLKGAAIYSANLTPDEATGIGKWSEADFVRTVRYGLRPDGSTLHYPMLPMSDLDEQDARAIYAYLRTVPARKHAVQRPAPAAPDSDPARQAYTKYGCASCHGETGLGLADLRPANRDYPADAELLSWILDAPTLKPGTRMPAWRGIVAPCDYPALLMHVRRLSAQAEKYPETTPNR
ncbi:MAG: c-type cytochrome [Polyangiaceae bacterium]